jgi:hypothetical protein
VEIVINNKKRRHYIANLLALSLALTTIAQVTPCDARGGGGGGHGGGFGGGFGGRGMGGFGDRDFGDRGGFDGDRGWGNGASSGFADRAPGGNMDQHPAVSEDALRSGADQSYHWGNSLPTDGGFSRGANNYTGATRAIEPGALTGRASSVRSAFNHYDAFGRDYWNRYRNGWWYPGWGDYWAWGGCGWGDLAGYWDEPVSDEPVEYDYGNNITYQGDTVYYGNQPMEPASTYYDQAQQLALSTTPTTPVPGVKAGTTGATASAATTKAASAWKPLGVFALTQGDQTDSNCIFQLAVDKAGEVRGNYYNPMTQDEQPVQGKVDKKNKRVAWTIGSNKQVVYDTGLANLLAPQSSILVHLSKSSTQQWNLVRLQKPASTPAQTSNNG